MLEKLQGEGHIYGLDVDPIESAKTKKTSGGKRIWIRHPDSKA